MERRSRGDSAGLVAGGTGSAAWFMVSSVWWAKTSVSSPRPAAAGSGVQYWPSSQRTVVVHVRRRRRRGPRRSVRGPSKRMCRARLRSVVALPAREVRRRPKPWPAGVPEVTKCWRCNSRLNSRCRRESRRGPATAQALGATRPPAGRGGPPAGDRSAPAGAGDLRAADGDRVERFVGSGCPARARRGCRRCRHGTSLKPARRNGSFIRSNRPGKSRTCFEAASPRLLRRGE